MKGKSVGNEKRIRPFEAHDADLKGLRNRGMNCHGLGVALFKGGDEAIVGRGLAVRMHPVMEAWRGAGQRSEQEQHDQQAGERRFYRRPKSCCRERVHAFQLRLPAI
jgi:hypothetical protein